MPQNRSQSLHSVLYFSFHPLCFPNAPLCSCSNSSKKILTIYLPSSLNRTTQHKEIIFSRFRIFLQLNLRSAFNRTTYYKEIIFAPLRIGHTRHTHSYLLSCRLFSSPLIPLTLFPLNAHTSSLCSNSKN